MNRYISALLFLIVILLGMFVIFVQPRFQSSRNEEIQGNILLLPDPDKIHSIRIRNGDEVIQIDRNGTHWEVGPRVRDRASPEVVAKIFQAAKSLHIFDKISSEEFRRNLKIKDFGLKWPKQRLDFAGDLEPEIWFGNEAVIIGRVYARKRNSQTVYVVPDKLQTLISRPLNAFRDRRLTQWNPDQIQGFVVKRGRGELEVQQIGNLWKISRPLDARADYEKIHKFLDAWLGVSILEFVDDDSGDLSRFGIDERSPSITLRPDTGEAPAVVLLGSQAPGRSDGYYVQFTARNSILRLPTSVVKLLEISPEELRERSLVHINPDILDRIIIRRSGNRSLVLTRKEEKWNGREGDLEFPVRDEQVQHFLSALQQQNIKKFLTVPENTLASYGLDQPQVLIEFYSILSENTPEVIAGLHKIASVAFSLSSSGDIVYARNLDSSEVLLVEPSVFALISSNPSDWK